MAGDVLSVTLQTHPVNLERGLEECKKVINENKKKVETLTKKLQVREFYICALPEFMVG